MGKKIYAVRKGRTPGIYQTWAECQKQIKGFSGAEFKGFASPNEAKEYMNRKDVSDDNESVQTEAVAYVDGSYNSEKKQFSCGVVFFHGEEEEHFAELYDDSVLAEMNNVAGEIKGSEMAIQYCLDNQIKSITIFHDYEGIAKWCIGEWQAKKIGTKEYKAFFDLAKEKVDIRFVKVKGHSGDKYNDLADKLARSAFELEVTEINRKDAK